VKHALSEVFNSAQGLDSLIGLAVFAIAVYKVPPSWVRLWHRTVIVKQEETFRRMLLREAGRARHTIRLAGGGSIHGDLDGFFVNYLEIQSKFLAAGHSITRIQTSLVTTKQFAAKTAAMMRLPGARFHVVHGSTVPWPCEVVLIDTGVRKSVVVLLFAQYDGDVSVRGFGSAIFLYRKHHVAATLEKMFDNWAQASTPLSPDKVEGLGEHYTYFAYGTHLDEELMRKHVPHAVDNGKATLHGWTRLYYTRSNAPNALGVARSPDPSASVEGIIYKIPARERRFDDFEANGYVAVENVTVNAGDMIVHDAFLFQPRHLPNDRTIPTEAELEPLIHGGEGLRPPPPLDLKHAIEGAEGQGFHLLAAHLKRIRDRRA
jgi:hypothetical protein